MFGGWWWRGGTGCLALCTLPGWSYLPPPSQREEKRRLRREGLSYLPPAHLSLLSLLRLLSLLFSLYSHSSLYLPTMPKEEKRLLSPLSSENGHGVRPSEEGSLSGEEENENGRQWRWAVA